MTLRKPFLWCLFLLLSLVSCNRYERILKSNDVNFKLTKANEYYDNKQYSKANELYQSVIPLVKGTRNFEPLYFRYAYSFYYMGDFISSAYHFKNYIEYFPSSKQTEECSYMYAQSLYKMSPKYTLEQTSTSKAVEALQGHINNFPKSPKVPELSGMIDELRSKLERKDADAARLYFDIGQYKAASVSYKNILNKFPDSRKIDFYEFMIVRSLYNYARQSVNSKQEERYINAVAAYNDFKGNYPKSQYLRDAEGYADKASKNLNKLKNDNKQ